MKMKNNIPTIAASVVATLMIIKFNILGIVILITLGLVAYGMDQLDLFLSVRARLRDPSAWRQATNNVVQARKELEHELKDNYQKIIDGSYYKKTPQDQSSQAAKKGGNSNE